MVTTGAGSRAGVMVVLGAPGCRKGYKDLREKSSQEPIVLPLPGAMPPAINVPGSSIQTGTAVKV